MGLFDWAKKKSNNTYEFGKKIIGTEEISKNTNLIKEMIKTLNPKEIKAKSKNESFLDAKKRLNVSELDIIKNYKNQVYSFYISLGFSLLCFMGTIYNLFILLNIIQSLSMLAIMLISLANCFRFSFRAFQIKHQKLCSIKEWWERSTEWIPKF